MTEPLILYIPGLKPKPEPGIHRRQLLRCLHAGLQKVDAKVAERFATVNNAFDLVSWTYDFYGEHRDMALDKASIDALLAQPAATERERLAARCWRRRLLRGLYRLGDRLPFLIPRLADESIALHLRDLRRYAQNDNDIAENTRRHLKMPLRAAAAAGRPVLLLAHSMGSVIAWDALWQLSRDPDYRGDVSLFMTIGSPLGQRYIQRRLMGSFDAGRARYPTIIRQWINIAAEGELTALTANLAESFSAMTELGLTGGIDDIETVNWYRDHGVLNVHAEYGYLVNRDVAAPIANWWRDAAQVSRRPLPGWA